MMLGSSFLRRVYKNFKGEILPLPSRLGALLFSTFLFFIPLLTTSTYILRVLIMANIFALYAVSWDLLSGYTGQVSFGHGLFFGVSAYTVTILSLDAGLPLWAVVPLGAVVAMSVGLIVGIPCLRLRGPYLALTTLAFPLVLSGLVFLPMFKPFTGGELGRFGIEPIFGSYASFPLPYYYASLLLMLVCSIIMWKITDSKFGIIFHAIREDEVAVRASGVNTTHYKLLAFSLSGFFAGISGGFFALLLRGTGPSTLSLTFSFYPIIFAGFGGIVSIYGAIGGAYVLQLITEFMRIAPEIKMLSFAVLIILVLILMPEGFFVRLRDKIEKECPRCKERSFALREKCRVCGAPLD